MKPLHIRSGSKSIIGSGVIMPFDEDEVTMSFKLPDPKGYIYDIDIIFKFVTDSGRVPGYEMNDPWEGVDLDDIGRLSEYSLTIYNCDQSNPVSCEEPIKLANFSGLNLYLNFVAKNEAPSDIKAIYYTVYTSFGA